jgi:complex iron-sulfur molybdoenzyme family reductase subunit gamma
VPSRRVRRALLLGAALIAVVLLTFDANPAVSQTGTLLGLSVDDAPGIDPASSAWARAPETRVQLTAQNVTYPFGGGSVPVLAVRALHHDDVLYLRIEWTDDTVDDATGRTEDFADAVAVQFPASPGSSVPAVCMGQADGGVNIWQWRADREAGAPEGIEDLHPDGYVDDYQETGDLFFPAREADNPVATSPPAVQDMVAIGFGTIGPAPSQTIEGRGDRTQGRWRVVVARPFPAPDADRPSFEIGEPTDVAFAVWDGSRGDRDGQKSVSEFVRLELSDQQAPTSRGVVLVIGLAAIAILALLGLGVAAFVQPRAPGPTGDGRT